MASGLEFGERILIQNTPWCNLTVGEDLEYRTATNKSCGKFGEKPVNFQAFALD